MSNIYTVSIVLLVVVSVLIIMRLRRLRKAGQGSVDDMWHLWMSCIVIAASVVAAHFSLATSRAGLYFLGLGLGLGLTVCLTYRRNQTR